MRSILMRVIAAAAFGAVLACSGMGLCWREVTLAKHDCCESEGTATAFAKPCASPVAHESRVELAPPATAPGIATFDQAIDARVGGDAAGLRRPATSRPAVLRI